MYLLGIDLGSSSVKASILDGETGKCVGSAFYPKQEMRIIAEKAGWAEQEPEIWWENLKQAIAEAKAQAKVGAEAIGAIGISYQMHGLVVVDKNQKALRPSIIWCDSRAVEIGNKAFADLGGETCLSQLLNSPGNFTASKLKWVKDNDPKVYAQIDKIMLPGDYLAMRMTGETATTVSGLSEGMFWNFAKNEAAQFLLDYYGISKDFLPKQVDTFSVHGELLPSVAAELGLKAGTKISYRAGDQPNNALSLNVLQPGELAATAGTSGVVYGVSGEIKYDSKSRVNTFAHVNHSAQNPRLGVLLCISGTGILNSWLKKNLGFTNISYADMNELASAIEIGSQGVAVLPFGNGAERVLENKTVNCQINNVSFNTHTNSHVLRAAQEGIAFSFKYGMDIMQNIGIKPSVIRAGEANMFLSPIFRNTLAGITGATIELYNTDGSLGAARGAGYGTGYYKSLQEAFQSLNKVAVIEPVAKDKAAYESAYTNWLNSLNKAIV